MTPIQALSLLDQAVALAPLNRATHVQVQSAVDLLAKLIKDLPKESESV